MKRFFALLLLCSMIVCSLVSCGEASITEILKGADEALMNEPYKLKLDIKMECDDPEYKDEFDVNAIDSELYFDGENFAFEMSMFGALLDFTCVDNIIYTKTSFMGSNIKTQCAIDAAQRQEFLAFYMSAASEFNPLDFEKIEIETKNKKTVVKCSDIKSDALAEFITSNTGIAGYDFGATDVELEAEFKDGKYSKISITLDCAYEIGEETVNVGCTIDMKFNYSEGKAISAPNDADSYEEVDFADLLG